MPVEQVDALSKVVQQLDALQLVFFFFFLTELGLIALVFMVIRSNNNNNKQDSEVNANTFKMMSQIYNSFASTTETFKREQEKDWQRTQQFFGAFRELFRIQKQIYYVIGRLEKRIELIENKFEVKNNEQK